MLHVYLIINPKYYGSLFFYLEGSKNALCNLLQNIFFFSSIFCENISGKLAVLKYKWTVIMFTLLKHSFMFDFLSFHNKTNKNIKSNHINFILDATRNYHLSICYSDLYLHWFYPSWLYFGYSHLWGCQWSWSDQC